MSAAPDELPKRDPDVEIDSDAVPAETPITPDEYREYEHEALAILRSQQSVSRDTDWVGRIENHIEHDAAPPRRKDLVRAIMRAPGEVMLRSVGTVGVSDYCYDQSTQTVIQRSHSGAYQFDSGGDEPIRRRQLSKREAKDLVRGGHLLPIEHWGADLEAEFDRYREWQRRQR